MTKRLPPPTDSLSLPAIDPLPLATVAKVASSVDENDASVRWPRTDSVPTAPVPARLFLGPFLGPDRAALHQKYASTPHDQEVSTPGGRSGPGGTRPRLERAAPSSGRFAGSSVRRRATHSLRRAPVVPHEPWKRGPSASPKEGGHATAYQVGTAWTRRGPSEGAVGRTFLLSGLSESLPLLSRARFRSISA